MKSYFLLVCTVFLFLSACTSSMEQKARNNLKEEPLSLRKENFLTLPSWGTDNFQNFAKAYQKSCTRVLKKNSQSNFGEDERFGKNQEWQIACRKFKKINQNDPKKIKSFFEANFIPYSALAGKNPKGLFTGYYEASLRGSRMRSNVYSVPLRARPDDLVMVDLGAFRDELKGQRIAGRVQEGKLKPYETHAEIIKGGLPADQDKALVWVDSAVDSFFLQIQGSGIVSLDDGTIMRVGYAGQNGHSYYAVGRELINRGELTKENVSMQSIRRWMEDNPSQAEGLMTMNKSYVFFTVLNGEGPLGAEGVALTPERSLAVDRAQVPYGMPVWLSALSPSGGSINQLMVTQDTGGAIKGAVRGDYFWGYGSRAEEMAGKMKSEGRYWFLLPKAL